MEDEFQFTRSPAWEELVSISLSQLREAVKTGVSATRRGVIFVRVQK